MNNEKFAVGDIGYVMMNLSDTLADLHRYNGADVEVVAGLDFYVDAMDGEAKLGYCVQTSCGTEFIAGVGELKRKPSRGDLDTAVGWDGCPWKPTRWTCVVFENEDAT